MIDDHIRSDQWKRRNAVFPVVLLFVCLVLCLIPTGFENRGRDDAVRTRGVVLSVDDGMVRQFGLVRSGSQNLKIRILDGEFKGREIDANNRLIGKMELDKLFKAGDEVFLVLTMAGDAVVWANASDHYRLDLELALLAFFGLLLVLFAGYTGVRALLSFIFTALMIWKVMVPCFLKGYDPILVSLLTVAVMAAAIIFLVGGLSRMGVVAFLGSVLGLCFTCVMALVCSGGFHINGAIRPFSETLLYSGFVHLDLGRIFLASIFTASSGAVMDLAIDISAAMNEVVRKKPDISRHEILQSGFAVGRAVIGTMTTTLLLAYSGNYITLLMLLMAQGIALPNIFNMSYVAAEVFHTLVGSFGN